MNEKFGLISNENPHKNAVLEVQQIQDEIRSFGGNPQNLVGDILEDLLNGELSPGEAIRRARLIRNQFPAKI